MKTPILLLLSLFVLSVSFAHSTEHSAEQKILLNLFEEEDSSILEYSQGRVYFNPDRLVFSLDGMFVQADSGKLYPISSLSFDQSSKYYQEPRTVYVSCRNPDCSTRFPSTYSYCPTCGTSR